MNAVITDRRIADQGSTATSTYIAVVINTADYYPFGMLMLCFCKKQAKIIPIGSNGASGLMPERHEEGGTYRYAYNGMLLIPIEVKRSIGRTGQ